MAFIRRAIFGKQTDGIGSQGVLTADAGVDQMISSTSTPTLDATASNSTQGVIISYSWTYTLGSGFVIDTPLSDTSSVSGVGISGEHHFTVDVIDDLGNTDQDTVIVTVDIPDPTPISLDLSDSSALRIILGENSETINCRFTLINSSFPDAIDISNVIFSGSLNYMSTSITGTILLDGLGEFEEALIITGGGFSLEVQIIGRSSSEPIPIDDRVTILIES